MLRVGSHRALSCPVEPGNLLLLGYKENSDYFSAGMFPFRPAECSRLGATADVARYHVSVGKSPASGMGAPGLIKLSTTTGGISEPLVGAPQRAPDQCGSFFV